MSKLDKEFQETINLINDKIKEASLALRDANKLAHKIDLPALILSQHVRDNMYYDLRNKMDRESAEIEVDKLTDKLNLIDVSNLEVEMCEAGWSTSNTYC